MEFQDRILKCIGCQTEFVFTAGEQQFFRDKRFFNDPKHCKKCKAARMRGGKRLRPETRINCFSCGNETTVPFKPSQGRPVLCRNCYTQVQRKNGDGGAAASALPQAKTDASPNPGGSTSRKDTEFRAVTRAV